MNEGKTKGERATVQPVQKLHYNFVFFFVREDYWRAILGEELFQSEYVHVYEETFLSGKILQKLFHFHWSYRINRKIDLPFKHIWFRKMYHQEFPQKLPLCFVYLGGNNIYRDGGFTKYVRSKNPDNRQVILHNDLISKKCLYDYSLIRNKVDLATTYDKEEAQKYNIHYFCETTYSKLLTEPSDVQFEQDVYFLGAAKDRLSKILAVYKRLSDNGIKCKFLIAGVAPNQRVTGEGIEYISEISYLENLRNVVQSKCILELIQGGSVDITTRVLEAIAYRRRMLTDCKTCNELFFNQGQLQIFSKPEKINIEFLKADFYADQYQPRLDMNPLRRLYDLQEQLEKDANV